MKTRSKFKLLTRADTKEPSRIDWSAVKPHVVVNESIQASLILFTLAIGALKLPMLLGLWMLELIIVTALTASFYPQRGRWRAVGDVAKIVLFCAILSIFFVAIYLAAGGDLELSLLSVLSAAALLVLRLATSARDAKKQADPKLAWSGAALARGAVVVIGMFIGIFTAFLIGFPLASVLRDIVPNAAIDLGLGIALLPVQVILAIVLSTMSDEERNAIARDPYVD
jgi:hypothetical protein